MAQMKQSRVKAQANHEIVAMAALLLGGDARRADTEDIAKRASELAPGRFTWREYTDQINIETILAFLSDAKKLTHRRADACTRHGST